MYDLHMSEPDILMASADLHSDDPARRTRGVRAVETLEKRGDPTAAYAIGSWLLAGAHGYPRDEARAAPYLQYAAERGVREAIFDLGVMTEERRLGPKPRREAFNRYLTAAILGDRDAAHEVVRCVYHGIGAYADPQAAERLHDLLVGGEQRPLAAE